MELMTMTMSASSAGGGQGQVAQGPTAMVSGSESKGAFGQILHQVAGSGAAPVAMTGAVGEAASNSPVGYGAMPLMALLLAQSGDEAALADTIGQLLATLQQEEGELAEQWLENPDLAAWFSEVAALLQMSETDQSVVTETGKEPGWQTDVRALLAQLLDRLTAGNADEKITMHAAKLRTILQSVAETDPAFAQLINRAASRPQQGPSAQTVMHDGLTAQATAQTAVAASPERVADEPETPVFRVTESRGDMGNRHLLDRLAHMNVPVHVLTGAAAGNETGSVQPLATAAEASVVTATNPGVVEDGWQPTWSPANPQPIHHLTTATMQQPANQPTMMHAGQFAEEMGEWMVKQFSVIRAGELSQARITLVPEHLGHLDVKISVQNGTVTALFAAETAGAREMLELQLPQLRTALQQQGFQVERLVVSQQAAGPGSGQFQDERQRQPWEREEQQRNSRENLSEEELFDLLSGIDESYGGESPLRHGSTFHATA